MIFRGKKGVIEGSLWPEISGIIFLDTSGISPIRLRLWLRPDKSGYAFGLGRRGKAMLHKSTRQVDAIQENSCLSSQRIDFRGLLGAGSYEQLRRSHEGWIEEYLGGGKKEREEEWKGSIAVGNRPFVERVKELLGFRAKGRKITKIGEGYQVGKRLLALRQ